MGLPGGADPFTALSLPARADLTDDEVRSAWRRIATATHPDRADGGDPGRFAVAAAAYTVLRTRSGRGEALADLTSPSPGPPRPRPGHPRARAATRPRPGPGGSPASPPSAASAGPAGTGRASAPLRSPRLSGAWRGRLGIPRLLSRIRRGRPGRLALRVLIAGAVSAVAITVDGSQPATPALITGAVTWLLLTARRDLAR